MLCKQDDFNNLKAFTAEDTLIDTEDKDPTCTDSDNVSLQYINISIIITLFVLLLQTDFDDVISPNLLSHDLMNYHFLPKVKK